jgi:hypothetical protein
VKNGLVLGLDLLTKVGDLVLKNKPEKIVNMVKEKGSVFTIRL